MFGRQIFLKGNIETGKFLYSDGSELAPDFLRMFMDDRVVLCVSYFLNNGTAATFDETDTFEQAMDTDFIHSLQNGTLDAAYSGQTNAIAVNGLPSVPATQGTLSLINAANEDETYPYTSWTEAAGKYTFVGDKVLDYAYTSGDTCNVDDPLISYSGNDLVNVSGDWTDANKSDGKISIRVTINSLAAEDALGDSNESIMPGIQVKKYSAGIPTVITDHKCVIRNVVHRREGEPATSDPTYRNTTAQDSIDNTKMDKVAAPTLDNLVAMDAAGNAKDAGVGTGDFAQKLSTDDIEITDATKGIILRNPSGTRFRITINNSNELIHTELA